MKKHPAHRPTARPSGANRLEFYRDHHRDWHWRRVAANGKVLERSRKRHPELVDAIQDAYRA
jgi:hypothetical protein